VTASYQHIITVEPGKRGGRPCIRGLRIAVADVLGWLAAGMSHEEILRDYPELTEEDIRRSRLCGGSRAPCAMTQAMKLHYYPETDSLYIELRKEPGTERGRSPRG
jgi:uncharacterized protein (DUF433 family)